MDIQKNGSYSLIFHFALLGIVLGIAEGASLAGARGTTKVLITSYDITQNITTAEAESVVADLEEALANCEDDYLAFRLKYRIAVIYFRACMMDASKARFLQIVDDPKCPEIIQACSSNMIGQISRLIGHDKEALEIFDKTANLLEQQFSLGIEDAVYSTLMELWMSALFSRAEIFETQQDYASAIIEYERLLEKVNQNKKGQFGHAASVNDRLSQLYLRRGDIGKYVTLAQGLAIDYPKYYRTGIVKFEIECVKFLKSVSADLDLANGSFNAPACTIAYLRNSRDVGSAQDIVDKLDKLSKEYANSYSGILLGYHYAWLLDALGERSKAMDMFVQISSNDCLGANDKSCQITVAETIQKYAKIQHAIMLGERANYSEALHVLDSLITHQSESHISKLAESVSKGIQTLKREVHTDEN